MDNSKTDECYADECERGRLRDTDHGGLRQADSAEDRYFAPPEARAT